MITQAQWDSLLVYKPSDFHYPDDLEYDLVSALDAFSLLIGQKMTIISDYRAGDEREHGQGRAADSTFAKGDPVEIFETAFNSGLFNGVGIYINELNAVSYHFDVRPVTIRATEPDRWGGIITHPLDLTIGQHVKMIEYVAAETVIDIIKKNTIGLTIGAIGLIALYLYLNRRR